MGRVPATSSDRWVIGLGGSSHDFSAAVAFGHDIRVAIEAERISRVKHGSALWFQDPVRQSIDYCLESQGISRNDIDAIVSSDLLPGRAVEACADLSVKLYPHHLCHAASAYLMLPPGTKAAIIVVDGMGSATDIEQSVGYLPTAKRETFSFYLAEGAQIDPLGATHGTGLLERAYFNNSCTNSLGLLYELVTAALGFGVLDAGKTMGLAGWGTPRFVDALSEFVQIGEAIDSVFRFDPFSGIEALISSLLDAEARSFQVKADLAASVQEIFTQTWIRCYELIEPHEFDVLCLSGGCALNTVANGALVERLPSDRRLDVAPYASDAGVGLGALWLHWQEVGDGQAPVVTFNGKASMPLIARPGKSYSREETKKAFVRFYPQVVKETAISSPFALAGHIADGKIIGFFNGPSEIGPRALGGRSILADPRKVTTRERINRRIKLREPFRPLAPIMLGEFFDDYFYPPAARDYFMLVVSHATERCLREAPAVVHVDGTARVQIVDQVSDPFMVELLGAFRDITGVPMLLNTSFNRRNEPIVETPEDAIEAFLDLGLDGLYLDGEFLLAAD